MQQSENRKASLVSPTKPEVEGPSKAAATSAIFSDPSRGGKVRKALVEQLKAATVATVAPDTHKIKPQESMKIKPQESMRSGFTARPGSISQEMAHRTPDGSKTAEPVMTAERELIEALKKQISSQDAIIVQQANTITMLQKIVDKMS